MAHVNDYDKRHGLLLPAALNGDRHEGAILVPTPLGPGDPVRWGPRVASDRQVVQNRAKTAFWTAVDALGRRWGFRAVFEDFYGCRWRSGGFSLIPRTSHRCPCGSPSRLVAIALPGARERAPYKTVPKLRCGRRWTRLVDKPLVSRLSQNSPGRSCRVARSVRRAENSLLHFLGIQNQHLPSSTRLHGFHELSSSRAKPCQRKGCRIDGRRVCGHQVSKQLCGARRHRPSEVSVSGVHP